METKKSNLPEIDLEKLIIMPRTRYGQTMLATFQSKEQLLKSLVTAKPTNCPMYNTVENDIVHTPAIGNYYFYLDINKKRYKTPKTAKQIATEIHKKIVETYKKQQP